MAFLRDIFGEGDTLSSEWTTTPSGYTGRRYTPSSWTTANPFDFYKGPGSLASGVISHVGRRTLGTRVMPIQRPGTPGYPTVPATSAANRASLRALIDQGINPATVAAQSPVASTSPIVAAAAAVPSASQVVANRPFFAPKPVKKAPVLREDLGGGGRGRGAGGGFGRGGDRGREQGRVGSSGGGSFNKR